MKYFIVIFALFWGFVAEGVEQKTLRMTSDSFSLLNANTHKDVVAFEGGKRQAKRGEGRRAQRGSNQGRAQRGNNQRRAQRGSNQGRAQRGNNQRRAERRQDRRRAERREDRRAERRQDRRRAERREDRRAERRQDRRRAERREDRRAERRQDRRRAERREDRRAERRQDRRRAERREDRRAERRRGHRRAHRQARRAWRQWSRFWRLLGYNTYGVPRYRRSVWRRGNSYVVGTSQFGTSGYSGTRGFSGSDGASGEDRIISLTESLPQIIDLSGGDGTPGGNGNPGGSASCQYPSQTFHDIYGASGGNGGSGGRGGTGGDGGDLIVYTSDLDHLNGLQIDQSPGYGASGGSGAAGGSGCYCQNSQWEEYYCDSFNDCYLYMHSCRSGQQGATGRHGSEGRDGNWGTLKVILQTEELPTEITQQVVPLWSWEQDSVLLAKHNWQEKPVSELQLNPSSRVAPTYRLLSSLSEHVFYLNWEASTPVTHFSDKSVTITSSGVVFPSDMWVQTRKNSWLESGVTFTEITVTDAVSTISAPIDRVSPMRITGSGSSTTLVVEDQEGLGGFVDTHFYIETGWDHQNSRRDYEQYIPQEYVTREGSTFRIALGRLPVKHKYFERGETLKLELTILRRVRGRTGPRHHLVGEFKLQKKLGYSRALQVKWSDIDDGPSRRFP